MKSQKGGLTIKEKNEMRIVLWLIFIITTFLGVLSFEMSQDLYGKVFSYCMVFCSFICLLIMVNQHKIMFPEEKNKR